MKAPPRYSEKYAKDPSVQGNMSVEDIIKRDWERNYKGKKSSTTVEDVEILIRQHIKIGGEIYRFRNTLFLVTPDDPEYQEVRMLTISADFLDMYLPSLLMMLATLSQQHDTQEVTLYIPDKSIYRKIKPIFDGFLDIETVEEDEDLRYTVVVDLVGYMAKLQSTSTGVGV